MSNDSQLRFNASFFAFFDDGDISKAMFFNEGLFFETFSGKSSLARGYVLDHHNDVHLVYALESAGSMVRELNSNFALLAPVFADGRWRVFATLRYADRGFLGPFTMEAKFIPLWVDPTSGEDVILGVTETADFEIYKVHLPYVQNQLLAVIPGIASSVVSAEMDHNGNLLIVQAMPTPNAGTAEPVPDLSNIGMKDMRYIVVPASLLMNQPEPVVIPPANFVSILDGGFGGVNDGLFFGMKRSSNFSALVWDMATKATLVSLTAPVFLRVGRKTGAGWTVVGTANLEAKEPSAWAFFSDGREVDLNNASLTWSGSTQFESWHLKEAFSVTNDNRIVCSATVSSGGTQLSGLVFLTPLLQELDIQVLPDQDLVVQALTAQAVTIQDDTAQDDTGGAATTNDATAQQPPT